VERRGEERDAPWRRREASDGEEGAAAAAARNQLIYLL